MLDEDAVVRSAAKVAHGNIVLYVGVRSPTLARVGAGPAIGLFRAFILPDAVHCAASGAGYLLSHVADETFQAGHSGGIEVRPVHSYIEIEVGDGVGELTLVLFAPLGAADQALFLGVPTTEHDRALRLPALLE